MEKRASKKLVAFDNTITRIVGQNGKEAIFLDSDDIEALRQMLKAWRAGSYEQ